MWELVPYLLRRILDKKRRLSRFNFQPSAGPLLIVILVYLVLSRVGPVLFLLGSSVQSAVGDPDWSSSFDSSHSLRRTLIFVRAITRTPTVLARSHSTHSYSTLTLTLSLMGNTSSCVGKESPDPARPPSRQPLGPGDADEGKRQTPSPPPTSPLASSDKPTELPLHSPQEDGTGLASSQGQRRRSSADRKESSTSNADGLVEFKDIKSELKTGDLMILHRKDQAEPSFAVVIDHSTCNKYFPLLLVKGRSKPMDLKQFNPMKRDVRITTVATRIFYGDFERVAVRRIVPDSGLPCSDVMAIVQRLEYMPFSLQERTAISEARTPSQRTAIVSMFILGRLYKELGVLSVDPDSLSLDNFEESLPLEEPQYIMLPPVKQGPMVTGDPPFLAQLAEGIRPMPEYTPHLYSDIEKHLQTGDLVLFSGATSSGALIKIFDGAIFSHIGIILRPQFTNMVMLWESSTNKAGLVDVDTGKVQRGVELLPLRNKIFSGWYDKVAIRTLSGLTTKERGDLYLKLLEVREKLHGRPYEKNHLELFLSAVDVQDKYLSFLRNTEEDLSSIFCSELVAHAYQEFGLLDMSKLSNEYTPDDFASHRHMELKYGHLEEEKYIQLKFDFDYNWDRQESVAVSHLNFHQTQEQSS